jgi:hypothetical protein
VVSEAPMQHAEMSLVEMTLVLVKVLVTPPGSGRHTLTLPAPPSTRPLQCWSISVGRSASLHSFPFHTAAHRSARAPHSFTLLMHQLYTLLNLQ